MIPYKASAYRPPTYKPTQRQLGRLGQDTPSGTQIKTAGIGLGLLSTTLSAATAWVGLHTGMKERGLISAAGWVVGLTGAIMGVMSLFGTMGLLLASTEDLDRAAREAEKPPAPPPLTPRYDTMTTARMPVLQEVL